MASKGVNRDKVVRTPVEDDARSILLRVKSPIDIHGEDGVDRILGANAEKERRILAYMTRLGFANHAQTDGVTISSFVRRFPLPMDFAAASEGFLSVIKKHTSNEMFAEYLKAMQNLRVQIYGERQVLYENMQKAKKAKNDELAMRGLVAVEETEAKEWLRSARIDGDMWVHGRIERRLTTSILQRNDLGVKWKMGFSGVEIGLTQMFKVGMREAILAYVKTDNVVKVRSYYKDNTCGLWKYLPDYTTVRNSAGKIELWCGEAYASEMVVLPIVLQERLCEIAGKGAAKNITDDAEFLFVGTAKRYATFEEYLKQRKAGKLVGDVYDEVPAKPSLVLGNIGNGKARPERLKINEKKMKPNFMAKEREWKVKTPLNGTFKMASFPIDNGKIRYVFAENNKQQAWMTKIEIESKVTSTGLLAKWGYAQDFTTPLYAKVSKSDGYGDEADVKGVYINMWKHYLSRMPIIQEYIRSKLATLKK